MARYYEPKHGLFLPLNPNPGDEDGIITQNGYTYANNNPVMLVDPDGHYVWAIAGAGFGGVASYKAARAKGARGWKLVGATAGGAALGAVGGGFLKAGKGLYKAGKLSKTYWNAKKVAKANKGTIKRARSGKGWTVTTKKHTVRFMGKNSGQRTKPYYRMSRTGKSSMDAKGRFSSDPAATHIKLRWNSYRNVNKRIR